MSALKLPIVDYVHTVCATKGIRYVGKYSQELHRRSEKLHRAEIVLCADSARTKHITNSSVQSFILALSLRLASFNAQSSLLC
jgi:hypothetical protein